MRIFKRPKLWIALIIMGIVGSVSLSIEFQSAIHSEPLIDKVSSGITEPIPDRPDQLTPVGFSCRDNEPTDEDVKTMVDEVIRQVLGPQGLTAIVQPGDKVVIKVNNVGPYLGRKGEKGRGVITDPRIVRYVAEKVREIIGFDGTADLKVVDTTFYPDQNPSLKDDKKSFHWARLERSGNNRVDDGDVCYDGDGDGLLDGGSKARLVNLDSLDASRRFLVRVKTNSAKEIPLCLPKFLRPQKEAAGSDEYCDVLIGLPVFKSHGLVGVTGALKLHYGFRYGTGLSGDTGRYSHSGLYWDLKGMHKKENLLEYLCAEHQVRTYDLVIMDCLTGNRQGPLNPSSGTFQTFDNQPVDYILTNAVMASRDPVAIDTVETAFAGYEAGSIGLLETARLSGLGTDNPKFIDLMGQDRFEKHRRAIYDGYHSKGRYPFKDGWGEAKVLKELMRTVRIRLSEPVLVRGHRYAIRYQIDMNGVMLNELARVDLFVNGQRVACRNQNIAEQGEFQVDLAPFASDSVTYQVTVWDRIFNCSLGERRFRIKG